MQRLRALQRLRPLAAEQQSSNLQLQRWMAAQPAPAQPEDLIEVTINGKPTKVPKGVNLLQACEAAGVDVPRYGVTLAIEWRLHHRMS